MRILAFLLAMTLVGCSEYSNQAADSDQATALRGGSNIIRLSDSEASGLDPQTVSDLSSLRIAMDQFEGLVRFDANGKAVAGLAQSWSISDDGLIWRFELKPDLYFSDSKRINASHFSRGFKRLQNPKTASPHLALFDIIASVEAGAGNRVIVALKSPFPQLLELLAHPAMAALPLHDIDAKGSAWTAQRPLTTSGPYQLIEWQLGNQMTLASNPKWHDDHGSVRQVIWKPMSDNLTAMRTFLSGAADTTSDVPVNRLALLKEQAPDALHIGDYLGTYYYAFNVRKPPFDNVYVRRALNMSIDRDWIAHQLIQSGNEVAYGLLPKAIAGDEIYRPEWVVWNKERRQKEARKLLSKAGYNAEKPLSFEIRFNSSNEHRRVSVAMASMWRDIGVEAVLLNSEASLHFASLRRHEFALSRSGWIADIAAPENFLNVHMKGAGPTNYSGFDDPKYEGLMQDAVAESDPKKRRIKMRRAEAYLMDQAPIIPLYHYVSRALVSPKLSGWKDNISNIHPSITLIEEP